MLNELKRLKQEFMSESMKPYRKYMINSLIFAVIVGTSFEVGPSIAGFMREKYEAKHYEENVWIEAEKANQTKQTTNKVDIAFNSIDTSSKMYRAMEETAIDMAEDRKSVV